ncbi:MAG: hypothetical protein WD767_13740 [Alphaproteobacteria bacterium]
MSDGIRLFLDLHLWFAATLTNPYGQGAFSLLALGGMVCLMVGAMLGLARPRRRLLLFLFPVLASQGFVLGAGLLQVAFPAGGVWLGLVFASLQIAVIGLAFFRNRDVWLPSLCLSVFCAIYAWYAHFAAATILNRLPVS